MAIIVGNKTASAANPSGSTQTLAHSMAVGANGALLICVTANNSSGKQIGSVTYGGQAVALQSYMNNSTFQQSQGIYLLNNPPTGSNNIVVTYTGGSQFNKTSIFACSLTGAGVSLSTGGVGATAATPNSSTLNNVLPDDLVFASGVANVAPQPYTIDGVANLPFQFNHNINKRVGGALLLRSGSGSTPANIVVITKSSSGSVSNHKISIRAASSTPTTNTGNFFLCM